MRCPGASAGHTRTKQPPSRQQGCSPVASGSVSQPSTNRAQAGATQTMRRSFLAWAGGRLVWSCCNMSSGSHRLPASPSDVRFTTARLALHEGVTCTDPSMTAYSLCAKAATSCSPPSSPSAPSASSTYATSPISPISSMSASWPSLPPSPFPSSSPSSSSSNATSPICANSSSSACSPSASSKTAASPISAISSMPASSPDSSSATSSSSSATTSSS
mmetsp:Transcript_88916/g.256448  ORF Transcript_88916/g.256448 Transcript_88916/m.256448 type:complete len:218 (-) Transcript_88916:714-1367(-)